MRYVLWNDSRRLHVLDRCILPGAREEYTLDQLTGLRGALEFWLQPEISRARTALPGDPEPAGDRLVLLGVLEDGREAELTLQDVRDLFAPAPAAEAAEQKPEAPKRGPGRPKKVQPADDRPPAMPPQEDTDPPPFTG